MFYTVIKPYGHFKNTLEMFKTLADFFPVFKCPSSPLQYKSFLSILYLLMITFIILDSAFFDPVLFERSS
jgi:hypothetical protein